VPPGPSVQPPPRPKLLSASRLHELTGHKLSHYDVGPVLANGTSGLVFKASDFKSEREVAFKVMWPEFSKNDEEIRPYCWVAMEYVEGESLTQLISRLGTAGMLDWKKALRIGIYLGRALEYAHDRSIVHRNITPQNVLIGKNSGITKLGDLMLAKALEGSLAQQITKPGEMLGDGHYMSPEQTWASTVIDARSDIFSLGTLLYRLLSGRPAFDGANLIDTVTKIRQAQPVEPRKFQLSVPDVF
jgi:serine/threonine protein kinase